MRKLEAEKGSIQGPMFATVDGATMEIESLSSMARRASEAAFKHTPDGLLSDHKMNHDSFKDVPKRKRKRRTRYIWDK
jgi:hypothetical protein